MIGTRDELLVRLAEAHRPVKVAYWDAAVPGLFLVHCPACDGPTRRIWAPGDPAVECELWRAAVALGVVA